MVEEPTEYEVMMEIDSDDRDHAVARASYKVTKSNIDYEVVNAHWYESWNVVAIFVEVPSKTGIGALEGLDDAKSVREMQKITPEDA